MTKKDKLDLNVKREMTFPELQALANITEDSELIGLSNELLSLLRVPDIWPLLWNKDKFENLLPERKEQVIRDIDELINRQSIITQKMHSRILVLLEQVTQVTDN